MQSRHLFMVFVTIVLIAAVLGGLRHPQPVNPTVPPVQTTLENVRDYAAAVRPGAPAYVIDGGRLFVGQPGYWAEVALPDGVIAGAVALVPAPANSMMDVVYVGAANELAVYRSVDQGRHWLRTRLTHEVVHGDLAGGVTDMAVDPVQRLIFVGTDTAGLFRLRDADIQLEVSAQLLLKEPVLQVVTDLRGRGMVLVRTRWHLYRALDYGLTWMRVDTLNSLPATIAVTGPAGDAEPPIMLVGTVDRGVVQSEDGVTWQPANRGLTPDTAARTYVDALVTDPLQPEVVYVATSQLTGPTFVHHTPDRLAYSVDGGANWALLARDVLPSRAAELLPLSGHRGGVYVLTLTNRTPMAVGNVPAMAAVAEEATAPLAAQTVPGRSAWLAWLVAGLAALALTFALMVDLLPPLWRTREQTPQLERYRPQRLR